MGVMLDIFVFQASSAFFFFSLPGGWHFLLMLAFFFGPVPSPFFFHSGLSLTGYQRKKLNNDRKKSRRP
jgi:hypothetical protein